MPDKVGMAIVATLAGFGACFLLLLLLLASMIGSVMIADRLREKRKKMKTLEQLKKQWSAVAVEDR